MSQAEPERAEGVQLPPANHRGGGPRGQGEEQADTAALNLDLQTAESV